MTKERISENYYRIKSDIAQMIESEIQKLLDESAKTAENQNLKAKHGKSKSDRKRG